MIEYAILLFAIPLGILLAKATQDEKIIYTEPNYFPILEKILVILIIIFIFQNEQIVLTLTFILIMIYVWGKF